MAEEVLVNDDIRSGEELLSVLADRQFPISSAFWVFSGDRWRFVVVSPFVETAGLRDAYGKIAGALSDILVGRSPSDPIFTIENVDVYGEREAIDQGWLRMAKHGIRYRDSFWAYTGDRKSAVGSQAPQLGAP